MKSINAMVDEFYYITNHLPEEEREDFRKYGEERIKKIKAHSRKYPMISDIKQCSLNKSCGTCMFAKNVADPTASGDVTFCMY